MRRSVSILFFLFAIGLPTGALADDPPVPAELLQAKTVFIQLGRVFRQKHDPTGEASNVEPCRDELNKWGRFKVVSDPKDADLIFRISNRDETQREFVGSARATGFVTVGSVYTVLDVVQPSTGKVVFSKAHSWSKSWSTKTAATGVVKDLRKRLEQQEKLASLDK